MQSLSELIRSKPIVTTADNIKSHFASIARPWIEKNTQGKGPVEKMRNFNHRTGVELNYQTFKQFIHGHRLNLPFMYVFSQVSRIPLSKLISNAAYESEKRLILNSNNLEAVNNIKNNKFDCALPNAYVHNEYIKTMTLPNDVDAYKKDELCLIDVSIKNNSEHGLYLVKSESDELKVVKLDDSDKEKTIGKVVHILTKV